jgi:hypothetical protein
VPSVATTAEDNHFASCFLMHFRSSKDGVSRHQDSPPIELAPFQTLQGLLRLIQWKYFANRLDLAGGRKLQHFEDLPLTSCVQTFVELCLDRFPSSICKAEPAIYCL